MNSSGKKQRAQGSDSLQEKGSRNTQIQQKIVKFDDGSSEFAYLTTQIFVVPTIAQQKPLASYLTMQSLMELEGSVKKDNKGSRIRPYYFDPYEECKVQDSGGSLSNQLSQDQVLNGKRLAEKVINDLKQQFRPASNPSQELASEERHNHKFSRSALQEAFESRLSQKQRQKKAGIRTKRVKKQQENLNRNILNDEKLFNLVNHLRKQEDLSLSKIASRVKASKYKIRRMLLSESFQFYHDSVSNKHRTIIEKKGLGEVISSYIEQSKLQVRLKAIKDFLETNFGVQLSANTIRSYLKCKLGFSFKKVYYINEKADSMQSKILRQHSAFCIVKCLSQQKIIINIDESSLQFTDNSKSSWSKKTLKNYTHDSKRLPAVSLIAGASSEGHLYFSVNQGPNNSWTIYYFLLRLTSLLDSLDRGWRLKTVLLLDNAKYHRSNFLRDKISDLQLPIAYLGPYMFEMAPIERVFSSIKAHKLLDSQSLNFRRYQRNQQQGILQSIAQKINEINFQWIKKAFMNSMSYASKYLSLEDI